MSIEIAYRYEPFSHSPGFWSMIPSTTWAIQAFPCRLLFNNLETGASFAIEYKLMGPVQEFTTQVIVQKNQIEVFGKDQKGFFRFLITLRESGCFLILDKCAHDSVHGTKDGVSFTLKSKESILLFEVNNLIKNEEKLYLGSDKDLNFDLLKGGVEAFLPLWYSMGSKTPKTPYAKERLGALKELDQVELDPLQSLKRLMQTAFKGLLVPQLQDFQYLGAWESKVDLNESYSLELLSKGASLIRSLFVQEDDAVHLLPNLPTLFIAGKFVNIELKNGLKLNMEWTKGKLRRVHIFSKNERPLSLIFQKEIKEFRLKRYMRDRGDSVKVGENIALKENSWVYLDRFQC